MTAPDPSPDVVAVVEAMPDWPVILAAMVDQRFAEVVGEGMGDTGPIDIPRSCGGSGA